MGEPGYRGLPKGPRPGEEDVCRVRSVRLGETCERALEAAVARCSRGESTMGLLYFGTDRSTIIRECLWRGLCDLAAEDEELLSARARIGTKAANDATRERYADAR